MWKLTTFVGVLALTSVGQAGLVDLGAFVNCDFETGDWSGWTVRPTSNGYTAVQDVVMYDIDGFGPLPTSYAGRLAVGQITLERGSWEGVYAVQEVWVDVGLWYTLDADVSVWNSATQAIAEGGRFELVVAGHALGAWSAGPLEAGGRWYAHVEAWFVPEQSGLVEAGLRVTRPYPASDRVFQLVDNFSPFFPPEPTSFLLLALGVLLPRR